ncbi:MAG: hypothetical protein VYD87_22370 [Pseudomonadota bacterium]|nr:hypothetical protein [Pseudomonadota bacterium]
MRSFPAILALGVIAFPLAPAQALTVLIDGDSLTTGSSFATGATWTSPLGDITFDGEFRNDVSDDDTVAAGASGASFDIFTENEPVGFAFSFDVDSITFLYGGNGGNITVEAFDVLGGLVDSFYQSSTANGQPAGPATLSGGGIRSLTWFDTGGGYAILDNIELTAGGSAAVPLPGAGLLMAGALAGLAGLSRARRR